MAARRGRARGDRRAAGVIRSARPGDARAIAEVHVASWRHAYRGLLPDDYLDRLSVEERERTRREHLEDPSSGWGTLVVDDGGRVVGFSTYGPSRDQDATPACERTRRPLRDRSVTPSSYVGGGFHSSRSTLITSSSWRAPSYHACERSRPSSTNPTFRYAPTARSSSASTRSEILARLRWRKP
jgi:hypothetical protein